MMMVTRGVVMISFKEVYYADSAQGGNNFLLAGDIGGTNSNFGIFQFKNKRWILMLSIHFKSKQIDNFTLLIRDLIQYLEQKHKIHIEHVCIGAAGPITPDRDYCKLTNAPIVIDVKELKKVLNINCLALANDFEIIGYGIHRLFQESIVKINDVAPQERASKAIIGAGTGLGASLLYWDCGKKRYSPMMSEGGHSDCSVQHKAEFALLEFIKKTEKRRSNISWEDLLSGAGIKRMYRFFRAHNSAAQSHWTRNDQGPEPDEIFNSRDLDAHAHATYELYTKMYARFAKSVALDALATGGLYIAGGIAAHNVPLFQSEAFMKEFLNSCKQRTLLRTIPIYVIADYNVSLYGAAEYMRLADKCMRDCL
jgi:glucokinase